MRKVLAILISIVIPIILFANINTVNAVDLSKISAKAAILMDAQTGKILYEKNANTIMPMASTTKIMTTLLSLESGNLDDYFVVDPTAIKVEGSSMGLVEGDSVTKRILCYGMMLPSGNDAANSTAVKIAGSIDKFIVMMNERAKKIGMVNTNFVTPSGLDDYTDKHYSTAYDMALLTQEALKNPTFREICSTKNARLEYGNPPYARWLQNSNKLLTSCKGVIGVKTGFTDKAKRCLVSACKRDGATLICVTLNDSNDWRDHSNLYDFGFSQIKKVEMPIDNQNMFINVVGGKREIAYCKQTAPATLTLFSDDISKITKRVVLPRFVYAPLNAGDEVGRAEYVFEGKVVVTIPIVVDESVEELYIKPKPSIKLFFKNIVKKLEHT